MLFLGTERFPGEGEFERYISSNGGSNNAFTASEDTNYFFDVGGDALPGALTRFADFFSAPLFTEAGTAREVDAIDSEHSKNLQSDFWRSDAVMRLRARPDHPYSRFSTGNRETLRNGNSEVRAALLAFYDKYYRAERMSLAVQGPQDLETLQRLVVKEFGAIPSFDTVPVPRASDSYDQLAPPYEQRPPTRPPYATLVVPVRETRSLSLTWSIAIDDVDEWLRTKPESIVLLLLGNRAGGGLSPYLKAQGLADSVAGGIDEYTRSFIILTCYVELTAKGLAQWRDVGAAIFSYIGALRRAGVPPHVYSDVATMRRLQFEYAEPASPIGFVQSAAGNMPSFAPKKWLTGPILSEAGAERLVDRLLSQMVPSTAVVKLTAQELRPQATLQERIYGARYGTMEIGDELRAWESPPTVAAFGPPRANPFVPDKLKLKAGGGSVRAPASARRVTPKLLESSAGVRLHFLQDRIFGRPKAFAFIALRSPALYTNAAVAVQGWLCVTHSLIRDSSRAILFRSAPHWFHPVRDPSGVRSVVCRYQLLLADALQDVASEAALAGLSATVGVGSNGLTISVSGFDQRLPELSALVASSLRSFDVADQGFERRRDQLCRQIRNLAQRQPVQLCSYYRNLALETPRYDNDALLAAAQQATLADVQALQAGLLPEFEMEAFVCGNMIEAEANAIVREVREALPAKPLPADRRPVSLVRQLPVGSTIRQFIAANRDEENSGIEVYLQVGVDEGDNWVLLTVLSQMISKAFYSELRTKQQLGYIVQCNANEISGVRGLSFVVQSSRQPPPEIDRRIGAFLREWRNTLDRMTDNEIEPYRASLAAQFANVDSRLDVQAGRLWQECSLRRYDFQRPWTNADKVQRVTRERLLDFFDTYISEASLSRRRLSTQVFCRSMAPAVPLEVQPVGDLFYQPAADQLNQVYRA